MSDNPLGYLVGGFIGLLIGVSLLMVTIVLLMLVRRLAPLLRFRDRLLEEDKELLGLDDKEKPDEPRG